MPAPYNKFCVKHGGKPSDMHPGDAGWLCDSCAREGINKCKCGGHARIFGEALMGWIYCESCDESVSKCLCDRGEDVVSLWNRGIRGIQNEY